MKPYLSILIPTFNRACMTLEAVKSVGNNPEVEIIVVDDCSVEEEYKMLQEGFKFINSSVVELYRNDINVGMTKNFNICMSKAKGDFFGLIGSDDLYKPGAIDHAVKLLHKIPPSLVVHSRSPEMWVTTKGVEGVRNLKLPSGSGNFWHRSIYEDLGGFDERLQFSPDAEYWYRIATKYPVLGVPEKYSVYREHEHNLMWDTWRQPAEFIKQIKLITRLNMVHRGEDTTDLDLVVASEGQAVWETVLYILKHTSTRKDKFDIFDMYIDTALSHAYTKDRLDAIKSLIAKRNEK